MKNVYVVFGSTGEYSDRGEWAIACYGNEKQAQTHVTLAESRARELQCLEGNKIGDWDVRREAENKNEYDPAMRVDYTGVRYYYAEVPFYVKIPKVAAQ